MSKKEEIAKLKEEIKLQELKLKKLELENKLDTDQEKVDSPTSSPTAPTSEKVERKPFKEYTKKDRVKSIITIIGLAVFFFLFIQFLFTNNNETTNQESSAETNSNYIPYYDRHKGCDGLEKVIDDGNLLFTYEDEKNIRNGLWPEERCQLEIDAAKEADKCRGDCSHLEESSTTQESSTETKYCSELGDMILDGKIVYDDPTRKSIKEQYVDIGNEVECRNAIDTLQK